MASLDPPGGAVPVLALPVQDAAAPTRTPPRPRCNAERAQGDAWLAAHISSASPVSGRPSATVAAGEVDAPVPALQIPQLRYRNPAGFASRDEQSRCLHGVAMR